MPTVDALCELLLMLLQDPIASSASPRSTQQQAAHRRLQRSKQAVEHLHLHTWERHWAIAPSAVVRPQTANSGARRAAKPFAGHVQGRQYL